LAAAMDQLLTDPVRTANMGHAAQDLARTRFDAAAQVKRIAGIYEFLLRKFGHINDPTAAKVVSA